MRRFPYSQFFLFVSSIIFRPSLSRPTAKSTSTHQLQTIRASAYIIILERAGDALELLNLPCFKMKRFISFYDRVRLFYVLATDSCFVITFGSWLCFSCFLLFGGISFSYLYERFLLIQQFFLSPFFLKIRSYIRLLSFLPIRLNYNITLFVNEERIIYI